MINLPTCIIYLLLIFVIFVITDVNAEMGAVGGVSFQDEVVQSARRGRFRVSAPAGPPETKLGRFRLMPSGE